MLVGMYPTHVVNAADIKHSVVSQNYSRNGASQGMG